MVLIKFGFKYKLLYPILLIFNIILAQNVEKKDSVSIKKDTIKKGGNALEDVVNAYADEIRNDFPNQTSYLIKNAKVEYQDMKILADYIVINWDSGDVTARGKTNDKGDIVESTTFTQGEQNFDYKEFKFNIKTKQGIAFGVRTTDKEAVIVAEKAKRLNENEYYLRRGMYTTDTYFMQKKDSLPDYHLSTGKIKMIKDEAIITGPIQMYIEQVPTPFVVPFMYIPDMNKRSAGLLIGTFGERESLGFYLDNWGIYLPINDYIDMELRAGVYSKGSWSISDNIKYLKNYRYNGNFNLRYEKKVMGTPGLSDYSKQNNYNVTWSHTQSDKANPNLSFSASVNMVSSNYYKNSVWAGNLYNGNVVTSTTSSSISLVKRFDTLPLSASLTASSSQSLSTGNVSMTLPNLNVSMSQQYPFAPKSGSKKGMLQNFYMNYSLNVMNQLTTTNDDLFSSKMFDNAKNGMKQESAFGTSTTFLNYFQLTLTGGYKEVWSLKTLKKDYDSTDDKVVSTDVNGFKTYRTFNGAASVQTTLYGQMNFNKTGIIQAVRHVMTPSVGYGYTPDFSTDSWGYYKTYIDKTGKQVKYSIFENGVFGSPGSAKSSSLNFSLANNLEMKVRDKKEKTGVKKIKIFESLNLTTNYNMAADSLKWGNISVSGSSSLLNSKIRVNYSGTIAPYKIVFDTPTSTSGHYVDKYGYFTLANYNVGMTFGLDPSMFGEKTDYAKKYKRQGTVRYDKYYFDDEGYAHFDIPWKLDFTFSYNNSRNTNRTSTNTASLQVNGSVSPSPYWDINFSTNYDIMTKKLGYTRIALTRDLRSFNITFNWVPFGAYKTWDFFIGIKANVLKDAVKYQERNFYDSNSSF